VNVGGSGNGAGVGLEVGIAGGAPVDGVTVIDVGV
jgi:hypothetical protein